LKQVKNPKTRDAQIVGEVFNQVGIKIDSKRDRKKGTYERWINKESLALCEAYHQHKLRQKAEREAKAQAKLEASEVTTEYLTRNEQLNKEVLVTNKTSEAAEKSELEQLVEALPFAESVEDFASIIEGSTLETVEDAIALAPDQPMRLKLTQWYHQLATHQETQASTFNLQPSTGPESEPEPEPIRVGQQVYAWIARFGRWGKGVVSDILEGVSWDVRLEGECLDTLKVFNSNWIEPLGMSG
jgi:hypothetical protein